METLSYIKTMLPVNRTMATGTQKTLLITCIMDITIWYFHNSGRYCHFPPSFEVLVRGKNTTIVRYSFYQIMDKIGKKKNIAGISRRKQEIIGGNQQ
jgi:hypothetical protein